MSTIYYPEELLNRRRWMVRRLDGTKEQRRQPISCLPARPADYVPADDEGPEAWRWHWSEPCVWANHDEALRYAAKNPARAGLNFVLKDDPIGDVSPRDRLICLDFDGAVDDQGNVDPTVAAIIDLVSADAWVEFSQSGRGLHLFLIVTDCPAFRKQTKVSVGKCKVDVLTNSQVATTGRTHAGSEVPRIDVETLKKFLPNFQFKPKVGVSEAGQRLGVRSVSEYLENDVLWADGEHHTVVPKHLADLAAWAANETPLVAGQGPHHKGLFRKACDLARRGVTGWDAVCVLEQLPAQPSFTPGEIRRVVERAFADVDSTGEFGAEMAENAFTEIDVPRDPLATLAESVLVGNGVDPDRAAAFQKHLSAELQGFYSKHKTNPVDFLKQVREHPDEYAIALGQKFAVDAAGSSLSGWGSNGHLPPMLMPDGNEIVDVDAAAWLGHAFYEDLYSRSKLPVRVIKDPNTGETILDVVQKDEMTSMLTERVRVMRRGKKGELKGAIVTGRELSMMYSAPRFHEKLRRIDLISPVPLLVIDDGKPRLCDGYNARHATLCTGEGSVSHEKMSLTQAVDLLEGLVVDFDFVSPGDRARWLAMLFNPAIVSGRLFGSHRSPMTALFANDSQAGKGLTVRLASAIYGTKAAVVTQNNGGVGSFDEAFSAAVMRGRPIVCLDNVRGNLASTRVESFLTEPRYLARSSYSHQTEIDATRYALYLTSNGVQMTRDLANRCSLIRIRKRPDGHQYHTFKNGSIFDHVVANQPKYLAAVFGILSVWVTQGCPRIESSDNDCGSFSYWAGAMDWISTHVFDRPGLMAGHRDAQRLLDVPHLVEARQIAQAFIRNGLTEPMIASEIAQHLQTFGLSLPGESITSDIAWGRFASKLFGTGTKVDLGDCVIERKRHFNEYRNEIKTYRFAK